MVDDRPRPIRNHNRTSSIHLQKRQSSQTIQLQTHLTTMHTIQNNRKPHTTTAVRRHRKRDAKNSIRLPSKPQHHRRDTRHPQNHGQSRTHRTRARHHTTGLGKSIRQNHPHQPHAYTQKIPSTRPPPITHKQHLHKPDLHSQTTRTGIEHTQSAHRHSTRLPVITIPIPTGDGNLEQRQTQKAPTNKIRKQGNTKLTHIPFTVLLL